MDTIAHNEGSPKTIDFKTIEKALKSAGASAVTAIRADRVDDSDREMFRQWMERGDNAGMEYMSNWPDLRFDPRLLHEETCFIICCAFSYKRNLNKAPRIASYALGQDYHKVIPKRIRKAFRELGNGFSDTARICVDSAPVRERYWAVKSGLGTRCDNGLVSIPGLGTRFFLTEILTPWQITYLPDASKDGDRGPDEVRTCNHCGACRRACPGGAIREDGTIDARRCVSYLTIEHKDPWTGPQKQIMNSPEAKDRLFGCEICQQVCPLNQSIPPTQIPEFQSNPDLLTLSPQQIVTLTSDQFNILTLNSPLRRIGLDALRRNARLD